MHKKRNIPYSLFTRGILLFHLLITLGFSHWKNYDWRDIESPTELFHWTSYENILRFSALQTGEPGIVLPPLNNAFFSSYRTNDGQRKPGIFTWTHPVAGAMANRIEVYGNNEVLIRFQIDSENVRAKQLVTRDAVLWGADLKGIDLLYFIRSLTNDINKMSIKEWIILNPKIIKDFTSHPDTLIPIVRPHLQKLKSTDPHPFTPDEIHATVEPIFERSSPAKQELVDRLEKFVQPGGEKHIPAFFLRKPSDCESSFHHVQHRSSLLRR